MRSIIIISILLFIFSKIIHGQFFDSTTVDEPNTYCCSIVALSKTFQYRVALYEGGSYAYQKVF